MTYKDKFTNLGGDHVANASSFKHTQMFKPSTSGASYTYTYTPSNKNNGINQPSSPISQQPFSTAQTPK